MNGHDYEYAVARYLLWHGFSSAEVTRGTGDLGVDVIATRHRVRYAVQCKYYGHPVGLAAVQEAVAGKAAYQCEKAMVVTNHVFTRSAKALAQSNDVQLWESVEPGFGMTRRPLPRPIRILFYLMWLLFIAWLLHLQRAYLSILIPWQMIMCLVTTLLLLLLPVILHGVVGLWRYTYWRIQVILAKQEAERSKRKKDEVKAQIDVWSSFAQQIGREPMLQMFEKGIGAVDTQGILQSMGNGKLLCQSIRTLSARKKLSIRSMKQLTGLDDETAIILANCLVHAGYWMCTKPGHYTWTQYAMLHRSRLIQQTAVCESSEEEHGSV